MGKKYKDDASAEKDEVASELIGEKNVADDAVEAAEEAVEVAEETAVDAAESVKEAVVEAAEEVVEATEDAAEELVDAAEEEPVAESETEPEEALEVVEEDDPEEEPSLDEEPVVKENPELDAMPEDAPEDSSLLSKIPELSKTTWLAIACAALVCGLLFGRVMFGGSASKAATGELSGRITVSESELDLPFATVTYGGVTKDITIREAILQNTSIEGAQVAEGEYRIPPADAALTVARNFVIEREAENRGITVSDDEIEAYALEMLGSADYEAIAASYGMDEDALIDLLRTSLTMSKLRDEVVTAAAGTMPETPAAPEATTTTEKKVDEESGEEVEVEVESEGSDVPTAEYAAYIIELAGDEWDAEAGTWASTDGPFATALANYEITPDGATYEAAQIAYYVAYQIYSESMSSSTSQWSEYVNGLLSNASITISTLVA